MWEEFSKEYLKEPTASLDDIEVHQMFLQGGVFGMNRVGPSPIGNCYSKLVQCEESRHNCERKLFQTRQIIKDMEKLLQTSRFDSLFTNLIELAEYPAANTTIKKTLRKVIQRVGLPSYVHPEMYSDFFMNMSNEPCEQAVSTCRQKNSECKKVTHLLSEQITKNPKYNLFLTLYKFGYGFLLEFIFHKLDNPKAMAYVEKINRVVSNYLLDQNQVVFEGIYEEDF